ncbi:MAG: hypothetical protein KDA28_00875, partial [Phycisphaerales bacterium]|nr:hypothetical protein [Phycisphaerales bacterium]
MSDFYDRILDIAREFMDREDELPPFRSPTQLHQQIDLRLKPEGRSVDEVLHNLREVMLATPSSSSHRFLNQLFGGREEVAVGAEMLAAVANTSMYTYKAGAVQILIENEVVARLASIVGYESYEGI